MTEVASKQWISVTETKDRAPVSRRDVAQSHARYSPAAPRRVPRVRLGTRAHRSRRSRPAPARQVVGAPFRAVRLRMPSNAAEHRAHRHALHDGNPASTTLRRHTPVHHRVFIAKDNGKSAIVASARSCCSRRSPSRRSPAITAPFTSGCGSSDRNLACFFVATTMVYVLKVTSGCTSRITSAQMASSAACGSFACCGGITQHIIIRRS